MITLGSGFANPWGVAVDAYGNVYVADQSNNAIKETRQAIGAPGHLGLRLRDSVRGGGRWLGQCICGRLQQRRTERISANSIASQDPLRFDYYPETFGMAVDNANNLYVNNSNIVLKIQPSGGYYISPALPKG